MSRTRAIIVTMSVLALLLAPTSGRASTRQARGDITITYDGEWNRAHGVRSGRGTTASPYIISGWTVGNITIQDTTRAFKIVDNTITGTLRLNWVGRNMTVRDNDIADLRVNENNARWGHPTAGTITMNTIAAVGQLRHFDGTFSHNTVGEPIQGMTSTSYPATRAVNFDGFNGAHFHHNTIYGYVEARLHGHHHASSYANGSHAHADGPEGEVTDHTDRFHQVMIHGNKIYTSNTFALAYVDTDHAANDRTANSETHPWLNAPHGHHTKASIIGNKLYGAGILVDVFNAKDEKHNQYHRGLLEITGNRVTFERDLSSSFRNLNGIEVRQARYLSLRISKNAIVGEAPLVGVEALDQLAARNTGIFLNQLERATVMIDYDRISNTRFGVRALQLPAHVTWTLRGLTMTDVTHPVSYDSSVKNPPRS